MDMRQCIGIAVLGLTLTATACTEHMGATKHTEASLYDRLGGKPAITLVVDDFVGRVAKDERINSRFANTNIPKFKMKLVEQICSASGGPCTYTGKDMKTTHAGMGISKSEFGSLVEALVTTLDKFKVGQREKNELLGALGPMQSDIVERS